jgi:hypothetical protein
VRRTNNDNETSQRRFLRSRQGNQCLLAWDHTKSRTPEFDWRMEESMKICAKQEFSVSAFHEHMKKRVRELRGVRVNTTHVGFVSDGENFFDAMQGLVKLVRENNPEILEDLLKEEIKYSLTLSR